MGQIRLARPLNGLIAALVVIVSTKITYGDFFKVFYLVLGAFFISSFINITNDISDIEVDRVNHPNKPLITGEATPLDAFMLSVVCLILSLYFSAKHSYWALMIGSLAMFIGILYNLELKSVPLLGNLSVSFVVFLAFLYGANPENILRVIPAAFLGAYLQLLREIVKSLEDKKGDEIQRKTIAHVLAESKIQHLIFVGIMVLTVLDILPVFTGYSLYYGIGVFLLVNGPLWTFGWLVYWRKYSALRKVLKLTTALAIIPLWVA